ncbi:hypothetical protein [Methyloglobulus morosus]|uniref:hypothetical protein n=1 Tax=Methyloglobulus morosus TaxID=1410681 RepID=UPI0003FCC70C|nr:hypothetical protein [Methyloglobulus morosus]
MNDWYHLLDVPWLYMAGRFRLGSGAMTGTEQEIKIILSSCLAHDDSYRIEFGFIHDGLQPNK